MCGFLAARICNLCGKRNLRLHILNVGGVETTCYCSHLVVFLCSFSLNFDAEGFTEQMLRNTTIKICYPCKLLPLSFNMGIYSNDTASVPYFEKFKCVWRHLCWCVCHPQCMKRSWYKLISSKFGTTYVLLGKKALYQSVFDPFSLIICVLILIFV